MNITLYGPGELPEKFVPGSFALTSGDSFISTAIQLSQDIRAEQKHAKWNHAVWIINELGWIAESLENGPVKRGIRKYRDVWLAVIEPEYDAVDHAQVMDYIRRVLKDRWGYSYLSILCILISLLTGSKLNFSRTATILCSGYVCDGLVRAGYYFPKPAPFMSPSDMAAFFGVEHPEAK